MYVFFPFQEVYVTFDDQFLQEVLHLVGINFIDVWFYGVEASDLLQQDVGTYLVGGDIPMMKFS